MRPIKVREGPPVFPPTAEIPARHVERKMGTAYANICKSYVNEGLPAVRDDSRGGEHQGGDTERTQRNKGGGGWGKHVGATGATGAGRARRDTGGGGGVP